MYTLFKIKKIMYILKLFIILPISFFIYLAFLFLGFKLRNKNITAQNLSKKKY